MKEVNGQIPLLDSMETLKEEPIQISDPFEEFCFTRDGSEMFSLTDLLFSGLTRSESPKDKTDLEEASTEKSVPTETIPEVKKQREQHVHHLSVREAIHTLDEFHTSLPKACRMYRQYRHHDSMRMRIQYEFGGGASPKAHKVSFREGEITTFDMDEPPILVLKAAHTGEPRAMKTCLRRSRTFADTGLPRECVFLEHKTQLADDLIEAQEKVIFQCPLSYEELDSLFQLALEHSQLATDNILCAYERVTQAGKQFLQVLYQFRACTCRLLVLLEKVPSCANEEELAGVRHELEICFLVCDFFQVALMESSQCVENLLDFFRFNSTRIIAMANDAIFFESKLDNVYLAYIASSQKDLDNEVLSFPCYVSYIHNMMFLREDEPANVLEMLELDLDVVVSELAEMEILSNVILEQAQFACYDLDS